MERVTGEVNSFMTAERGEACQPMSVEQVALGFIEVANEAMCRPIRALTQVGRWVEDDGDDELMMMTTTLLQAKGYDTSQHVLACFGGAGGQHACAIEQSLGMKSVFIHRWIKTVFFSIYGKEM